MKALLLTLAILLPLTLGLTLQEDDLVFDDIGEDTTASSATASSSSNLPKDNDKKINTSNNNNNHPYRQHHHDKVEVKKRKVQKYWGLADAPAIVGHVFKMKIPQQAFVGYVDHYEVKGINGRILPSWLSWDDAASTLSGVPSRKDVGQHHVVVKAFGKYGDSAKDSFTIEVIAEKREELRHKDGNSHCEQDEDQTLLTLLLDVKFKTLRPQTKVEALENLAGFLGLHTSGFSMHSLSNKEDFSHDSSVILTGPGNVKHRKENHGTAIQWQVGCDGHLWRHQADLLKQIKDQAKDGTLAEVLQLPVLSWRVKTDVTSLLRSRRETGSGDYENPDDFETYDDDYEGDYEEEDEDFDKNNEGITDNPFVDGVAARENNVPIPDHPHRHHHGEESIIKDEIDEDEIAPRRPVLLPEPNATTPSLIGEDSTIPVALTTSSTSAGTPTTPGTTTTTTIATTTTITTATPESTPTSAATTPTSASTTTTERIVTPEVTSTSTATTTTSTTPPPTTTTTPGTTPTTTPTTTTRSPTTTLGTTPTTTTTTSTTTEKIEYGVHNFPPRQDKRLKKIPITAGKLLSFFIPENTFSDLEDGNTRKLKLSLYLQDAPLKSTHWLQFNPHTQEVYGLPLENDISTWDYKLVASDSEGLNVSDRLDIHVQQHKHSRTVNHEFSIYLRIEKRNEFPTNVDWELKVLRSLAELYGDSDPGHITVRSIDIENDQAIFTWTNDSLPRGSECPKKEINKLLHVLMADKDGDPSNLLREVLYPSIRVKRVVYQGIGQCEEVLKPVTHKAPTQEPKPNNYPIPRNPVDHINATVGQLLIFKVPEDTFYDPEDGPTRNLRMSLLTIDRNPLPSHEWLQFDTKNQEFYGVPLYKDIGRKEYQLIAVDKEGSTGADVLVVVVHPAAVLRPTVEFSMVLDVPYESFAYSAMQKRNFIQKLRLLFQDKDTTAISLDSISKGSTSVTWRNRTLPTSYCPNEEITKLREVLVKDDKTLTDRVEEVMGQEFPVMQITLTPMGMCLGELTGIHSPDSNFTPIDDSTAVGASHDDYLITFVLPAIIIAAMLILAGIIACVLYKRRRSGKMSVSEQDDERQSFRSKGPKIPVIFQDELDEKPDPGNKSPVILKEEKPPLPPPEYQKTEDGADVPMLPKENSEEPYQPPPPFATNRDNNRQNRPKPTPTYRKPPPYVPP